MGETIFDFDAKANDGSDFRFGDHRGKVFLIVNTASKCGFTPQYEGLEALHRKYAEKGLVVVGFPCDQFAHQEPAGDGEIAAFCKRAYGVSFPLMAKSEVNGPGTHPVFAYLRRKTSGLLGSRIRWNFTKFLVGRDGVGVKRFPPTFEPSRMEDDIENALRS